MNNLIIKPNSIVSKDLIVSKVLIWNRTGNEQDDDASQCELIFQNKSSVSYECDDVKELEDQHKGIYELLSDGIYKQIEDWE